jgi:hypothetical protein
MRGIEQIELLEMLATEGVGIRALYILIPITLLHAS